jgi:ABC-type arginine transport system permease subunit
VYRANLLTISLLIAAAILGIIIGVIVADTYGTQQEEQQQKIPINGSIVKLTQNYEFIDENELAAIESNDD